MTTNTFAKQTDKWVSWGRVVQSGHQLIKPNFRSEIAEAMESISSSPQSLLPVGLARSYGTSGLNSAHFLMDMTAVNRLQAFDPETATLRVDAGASLWDVLSFSVPLGYFLPTTPGTRYVTIGGAIANDVHGKNHHHAGTFGTHVKRMGLIRSDLGYIEVSANENDQLFNATIGGLGLTGVIVWADVQLIPISSSQLEQTRQSFANLDEFFSLSAELTQSHEFTVSWIDCLAKGRDLGRGIFTAANWSQHGELNVSPKAHARSIPFDFPNWALNNVSIRAFNELYYRKGSWDARKSQVEYGSFFYPLDQIAHWNRIYGKRGFFQYQSVIPMAVAQDATREMLKSITDAGQGSFLAVLKTFGESASPGLLSFPMEGVTLALDFPNLGRQTEDLFVRLDAIVAEASGRLYPAKDGRIPPQMMTLGYPNLVRFKKQIDPRFSSNFLRQIED